MRAPGRYGTYPGRARGGAVLQWAAASHSLGQRRAWLGQWAAARGACPAWGGEHSSASPGAAPEAEPRAQFETLRAAVEEVQLGAAPPGCLWRQQLLGSRKPPFGKSCRESRCLPACPGGQPNLLSHLTCEIVTMLHALINPRGLLLPMVLARRWLKKAKPSLHQTANPTELLFVRHRSTSIREETSFTQQGHPPIIYNPMLSHVNPHDRQSYHRSGHTLRPMLRASGFPVVQSQKGYPSHRDGWM